MELFYDQHLKDLTLTFSINEDVKHYQCDLIQIFDEAMDIQNMSIPCDVEPSFKKNSSLVSVSFNLDQYGLCSNEVKVWLEKGWKQELLCSQKRRMRLF